MLHAPCPSSSAPTYRRVTITLTGADPLGPAVRRLSNSNAVVVSCRREALGSAWNLDETDRTGVYVLLSPSPDETGRLAAYVGRGLSVADRIRAHHCDRRRDFFLNVAMIVSADDTMSYEEAGLLERRVSEWLDASEMVQLANKDKGSRAAASPQMTSALEQFFDDALTLFAPVEPMLALIAATATSLRARARKLSGGGQPLLAAARSHGGELYELRRHKVYAIALRTQLRGMRLFAGSRISAVVCDSLPRPWRVIRNLLAATGDLRMTDDPDLLVLLRDVDMPSPTAAASLACVSACNFGSDSLLMKFKRRLALVSKRNQHDATSPTSFGPGPSRVLRRERRL